MSRFEFDDDFDYDEDTFEPLNEKQWSRPRGPRAKDLRPMQAQEIDLLEEILRTGTPYYANEFHRHLDGLSPEMQRDEAMGFYHDAKMSRLSEHGYIHVHKPVMHFGSWLMEAEVTQLGFLALRAADSGLIWDMNTAAPAIDASIKHWTQRLECARWPGEDVFSEIMELQLTIFDKLKKRIPSMRVKIWRQHLERNRVPMGNAWEVAATLDLPGMNEVRKDLHQYHIDAWKRALQADDLRHDATLIKEAMVLGPEFTGVSEFAKEMHVQAWVRRVQGITDPDSKVFNEVEALSDDYHLAKAEAFLQKMKCWTPLDNKGRRT